jgi:CheY-like chemotaxis protein
LNPIDASNRRRHPRARDLDVVARLVTPAGQSVTCAVQDLSAGGVRVVGAVNLTRGERVRVILDQSGHSEPLALAATVRRSERVDEGCHCIALQFETVPDPVQDAVQRVVLRAFERQRASSRKVVLVIDDEHEVRAALERDLNRLGYYVVSVAMPLDAIRCLLDGSTKIEVAFIDLGLGDTDGLDVIAYLADERPEIRRVVMSGKRMDELEREVSSGQAHALLKKPWQRASLQAAVG